jgi:O-antigen/teichoic acid export membrane protein
MSNINSMTPWFNRWRNDHVLARVVKNSGYLFTSNVISALLSILTANLLGVRVFGVLGIVISFVSNINRLLSFRMGDVVVKYMSNHLARDEKQAAAAVIKAAALTEGITSLLAYGILAALAPLAATYIADDPTTLPLFLIYGLSILSNITTETATGVLQVGGKYRSMAFINFLQSIATAGIIVYAYFSHTGLTTVLMAYLTGKMILGLAPIALAIYWLPRMLGKDWINAPFSLLPPRKEFIRFSLSTNFSGTINMVARDSEVLWVGYFFSPLEAGYFKTALAIINLVVMPITPFISTTYPEITRAIAEFRWARLRRLISRVTAIAAAWTGVVAIGLILVGKPILFDTWNILGRSFHIYKPEFAPAFSVLLILLVGFGFANILFWNRPLLLALGKAEIPLHIGFWGMVIKVILSFLVLPRAGYLTEAWLLSGYFVLTIGVIIWQGYRNLQHAEAAHPQAA